MSASPSSGGGTFGAAPSHRLSTRVCDNCIRFVDPASTLGTTVSDNRRASAQKSDTSRHLITPFYDIEEDTLQADSILEDDVSSIPIVSDLPTESPDTLATSHTSTGSQLTQGPNILPEEEAYLADEYFKSINEAIPLFSETAASNSKDTLSTCSLELTEAMLLITAKLLGFKFASPNFNLHGRIDLILSNTTLQEDTAGDFPSLDLFRKFCLLVFYEFHQFPGQQAWVRIGKIVRLAYWMGLDRLDIIQSVSPEWSNVSDADIQSWRLVWWCVYRLDSYANLSSGTPYQVDERLVNTSLNHQSQLSQGLVAPCRLPHDPRGLPDLLLCVKAGSESSLLFNIHLIAVTVLRQFGRAMSMRYLVPHEILTASLLDAEQGDDWTLSWQRVLETCQNIAGVAEKWDSNYTLTVDPALSLISLTALVFLDVHKKYIECTNTQLIAEIENCELLLLLQLEQFSAHWKLPGLLILSFKSFKESVTGPLYYAHIQLILSRFESPLHPRWLQFLSSAQTHLENDQHRITERKTRIKSSMSENKITFFDIPSRSPQVCWSMNTWRTRLLLNYKGLDYKTEWLEYPEIKERLSGHVSPNQGGAPFTCPAVQFPDGSYVMDSYKIADLIEGMYPEPSVHLKNPMQDRLRASMIKFMTEMVPIYVPGVAKNIIGEKSIEFFLATRLQDVGMPLYEYGEKHSPGAFDRAEPFAREITALLKENKSGPFLLGDVVSYADFIWAGILLFFKCLGEEEYKEVLRITGDGDVHTKFLDGLRPWTKKNT
ncbi:glutathione-S-transferase [Fusarium pseudoanthophilum]|uniref:Glutathione-S-transferase n=1 Tax=Fusarium pseudoanthophilum TaxID=48495 RepID=A0A8H5NN54_9HYPO|nr:glutathione-S-transferase [Fusarium pseudoanthophilum]